MNTPDPPHWTQYSCFVVFRSVWAHLGPFRCFMILGSKQDELLQLLQNSWHKVALEFFATNPPDPHHRTLNSCFGAFRSVCVDLGSFLYCTKLDAKWAGLVQLMQKFMPRCRARIFRNECSPSTPLDPKLLFWCFSFCLGAFGTVLLLHETWCKTHQTGTINAKFHATISRLNFSQRTLPIHTIGP